jgi:hypothetical protein
MRDKRPSAASSWRKSSHSFLNGNCVEVADLSVEPVAVRDTEDPGGGLLRFTTKEWDAFVGGVQGGEFDVLARDAKQQGWWEAPCAAA